jgi:DNA-binding GntR family transcriptional regulator
MGDVASLLIPEHSPQQLADWAADRIRDSIIAGRLRPGAPLGLVGLGESLGISVTPVREALRKLNEEGIVTGSAHKTFRVADLCLDDIRDFHRLHAFISADLAVRAAQLLAPSDLDELRFLDDSIDRARAEGDSHRMHEANFALHRRINMAAPRSPLHSQLSITSRYVSRRTYPDVPGWLEGGITEHLAVIEALEARDAARIRDAISQHFMMNGERLIDDLREKGGWRESRG